MTASEYENDEAWQIKVDSPKSELSYGASRGFRIDDDGRLVIFDQDTHETLAFFDRGAWLSVRRVRRAS